MVQVHSSRRLSLAAAVLCIAALGGCDVAKFTADSNAEGHADRAWSCFLACYGAGIPFVPIEFQSTGDRRVSLDTSDHDGGVLPSGSRGFGSTGGGINFGGF